MLSLLKDNKFIIKYYPSNTIVGIDQTLPMYNGYLYTFTNNKFEGCMSTSSTIYSDSVSQTVFIVNELPYPTLLNFKSNIQDMKYRSSNLHIMNQGGYMYGISSLPVFIPKNTSGVVDIYNPYENVINVTINRNII